MIALDLNPLLTLFSSIGLEEMGKVRLMNRLDTKYVVSLPVLAEILKCALPDYRIQEIKGQRCPLYHTTYLETQDYAMYLAHHNGKKRREKIRVRTYEVSGISFLEVKNKTNKGRTKIERIQVEGISSLHTEDAEDFLRAYAWYDLSELRFFLENSFGRITLVNHAMTERVTIDLNLYFHNLQTGCDSNLSRLAVIELKRNGRMESPMADIMCGLRVKPCGFSKYCIGTALTSDFYLKKNRFKAKLHMAERLIQQKIII